MNKNHVITLWVAGLAGAMDSLSGLMLVFFPGLSLGLMGVPQAYTDWIFVSFVGAFVFAVGVTYLYGLWSVRVGEAWAEVRTIWKMTAWIRSVVSLFTAISILAGFLSPHWLTVPVTDGLLAAFQFYWLVARRFPENA